jgi:hypothetical protein
VRPEEVPEVLEAVRRGEEPLPDRQLKRLKSADPNAHTNAATTPPSAPEPGTEPPGGGAPWA